MRVNLFGLGYVGTVTSICLAHLGHDVIGIEVMPSKVDLLNQGKLPIFEPGLEQLFRGLRDHPQGGSFRALPEANLAVAEADVSIVCVGTPNTNQGEVDLSRVRETAGILGRRLGGMKKHHTVVFRSTVPPGTTENVLLPILEAGSGKKAGRDFAYCFYPEFLREGQAIVDFFNPSLNIVGTDDEGLLRTIAELFRVDKKAIPAAIKTAEMIKYANNSFHALKVAFANEMGALCKEYDVCSDELAELFVSDRTLNISPCYLRPGFAFGGSCLPKELRSISALAREKRLRLPLLDSILESNAQHVERLVALIDGLSAARIGFLGVTFKPETDDMRESPILSVIERISQPSRSYKTPMQVYIHDRAVVREKAQRMFGERIRALATPQELLSHSDIIVLGPLALDAETESRLLEFPGLLVDLRWHPVSPGIKALPGFREIC